LLLQSLSLKLGADCQSALPWFCLTEWSSNSAAGTVFLLTADFTQYRKSKVLYCVWHCCEKRM